MAGLTEVQTADVAVRLKRKRANEKVLESLGKSLTDMFPGESISVSLGREELVKLRRWGDVEERRVRRLVVALGGRISRR